MDQDAFRKLLATPNAASTAQRTPTQRGSLVTSKAKKDKSNEPQDAKSEFKPRKVKKKADDYRDRAAERRAGAAGDFADVEAVLETFEKQNADAVDRDAVEEKRQYLGGDSEHSVLVKGLDFSLLEQTKARVVQADDDDSLEDAFRSASAATDIPKKRTREDIVRELKEKRTKGEISRVEAVPEEEAAKIEKLKKEGKFKPIGFKPISALSSSKGKDHKDGTRRKKKRKIEATTAESNSKTDDAPQASTNSSAQAGPSSAPAKPQAPEPEPVDDDFDIFADAGEYKGIDFDEEDEEESKRRETHGQEVEKTVAPVQPGKWFVEDEPKAPSRSPSPVVNDKGKPKAVEPDAAPPGEREPEPEEPTRLAPLASSSLPSIRDVLAIDEALGAEEKRRARKEKKKVGGGGGGGEGKKKSAEAKLDRDYQKLKSYQEKRKAVRRCVN